MSNEWSMVTDLAARNEYKKSLEHLQVGEDCSLAEAKNAFIKLAKLFHPDSKSFKTNSVRFSEVRRAYLTVVRSKQIMKEWSSLEEQDWRPELVFDIEHTAPQHRQYLESDGVGTGTPIQRQRNAQKEKFSNALDSVYEHRKTRSIRNEHETAVGFHDTNAKIQLDYQKRHRSSQTLVQLAEDLISQAMKRGEFDNLKGAGQPLKYATQNPYIDTHTKYLNDFLINSGYTLDWISLEKYIRESYEQAREECVSLISKQKGNISQDNPLFDQFKKKLKSINKLIDNYNLQVPILSKQKLHFDFNKIYKEILTMDK